MKWIVLFIGMFGLASHQANSESVRVVTELFYPYQQLAEDNELTGYSVDVVNQLAANVGDTLRVELLPWAVAYQRTLDSPDTMIFSIGKTKPREPLFAWVGSLATEKLYLWGLSQSQILASDNLEDFRPYRIAVVKEATTHQLLRASGFESLYIMSGSDSNVSEANRIKMMIKGRADIIIAAEPAMYAALEKLNLPVSYLSKLHRAKALDSELNIAFSKQSRPELVARYKKALENFKSNGTLKQLQEKWGIR